MVGEMTSEIYTPHFLSRIVLFLENPDDDIEFTSLLFFNTICRYPFRIRHNVIENTNILSRIAAVLPYRKFVTHNEKRIQLHYLILLSSLTLESHKKLLESLSLFKWIFDQFLMLKHGEIFNILIEILEHMDEKLGKAVVNGLEPVLFRKLQEMILNENNPNECEGGLAILSTFIWIDEYFADKFIEKDGVTILQRLLFKHIATEECFMAIGEICRSREIYREFLYDKNLLSQLIFMAKSRSYAKYDRIEALCTLCGLLSNGTKKQVLNLMNEGILDFIVTIANENSKDQMVYRHLRQALKRIMQIANKGSKIAKQKLYELNCYQAFEKSTGDLRREIIFARNLV